MITAAFRNWDASTPRPHPASNFIGLTLRWSNDYTLTVRNDSGVIEFTRDRVPNLKTELPADVSETEVGFYNVHLRQQIWLPKQLVGLILPVFGSFDPLPEGTFHDFPAVVPSILDVERPDSPLTIRCKLPRPGEEQVFYAGMPICQIVPTPRGTLAVRPMSEDEIAACEGRK